MARKKLPFLVRNSKKVWPTLTDKKAHWYRDKVRIQLLESELNPLLAYKQQMNNLQHFNITSILNI
jgi:hypothetical protein